MAHKDAMAKAFVPCCEKKVNLVKAEDRSAKTDAKWTPITTATVKMKVKGVGGGAGAGGNAVSTAESKIESKTEASVPSQDEQRTLSAATQQVQGHEDDNGQ